MGLDAVELVMEVEESFGVSIPDDRACKIQTVGELYDFLLEETRDESRNRDVCLSAATFYAIRRAVNTRLGVKSRIHPDHRVDAVLPKAGRRAAWRAIEQELDLRLPALSRPSWLVAACFVIVMLLFGGTAFAAHRALGPEIAVLTAFVSLIAGGFVAAMLTVPCATVPRSAIATFRGLSNVVLAMNYARISARYNSWTPADVWNVLSVIIVDQLGVGREAVTKDAHIVRDLGAE